MSSDFTRLERTAAIRRFACSLSRELHQPSTRTGISPESIRSRYRDTQDSKRDSSLSLPLQGM